MKDRVDRYPFLEELFGIGGADMDTVFVYRHELTDNTLLYRPITTVVTAGDKYSEDTADICFVLKDGTVLKNIVERGICHISDIQGVPQIEGTDGETVLEAWHRTGYAPDQLLYLVVTVESKAWDTFSSSTPTVRYRGADIYFLPGDRCPEEIFADAEKKLAELNRYRQEQVVELGNGIQVTLQPMRPSPQGQPAVMYRPVRFQKGAIPVQGTDPFDYELQVMYRVGREPWYDELPCSVLMIWVGTLPTGEHIPMAWDTNGNTVQETVRKAITLMETRETVRITAPNFPVQDIQGKRLIF